MGLTLTDFPKPAFYKDLATVFASRQAPVLLIMADAPCGQAAPVVQKWLDLLPNGHIWCVAAPYNQDELVDLAARNSSRLFVRVLSRWVGHRLAPARVEALLQGVTPDAIVSIIDYDPYGVYVKRKLESSMLPLVSRWRAVWLVHDPANEVLRPCDADILTDRLHYRPLRFTLYALLVRLSYLLLAAVAWRAETGWATIKNSDRQS